MIKQKSNEFYLVSIKPLLIIQRTIVDEFDINSVP